jgi:hypothetical protein
MRWPADARLTFQTGQPVDTETLSPFADDLARRIQAGANEVVHQPRAGQKHDLRPNQVSMGRPISARPPDKLRAFRLVSLMRNGLFLGMTFPLARTAVSDSPGQRPQNTSPY